MTADGRLDVDGWSAWRRLDGAWTPDWPRVLDAADAFHALVAREPRPAFIDSRSHRWALADRVAWGELAPGPLAGNTHVARLFALRRSVDASAQLIHGDLAGNVMFAPDQAPGIIDIAAYWRPLAYARAIVVVDAIAWYGAPVAMIDLGSGAGWHQLLIRALLFRIVSHASSGDPQEPFDSLVDAVTDRISDDEGRLAR